MQKVIKNQQKQCLCVEKCVEKSSLSTIGIIYEAYAQGKTTVILLENVEKGGLSTEKMWKTMRNRSKFAKKLRNPVFGYFCLVNQKMFHVKPICIFGILY